LRKRLIISSAAASDIHHYADAVKRQLYTLGFSAALTHRSKLNKRGTMAKDKLNAFKQVIRRRIEMRRIMAARAGDEELARSLVVRGARDRG